MNANIQPHVSCNSRLPKQQQQQKLASPAVRRNPRVVELLAPVGPSQQVHRSVRLDHRVKHATPPRRVGTSLAGVSFDRETHSAIGRAPLDQRREAPPPPRNTRHVLVVICTACCGTATNPFRPKFLSLNKHHRQTNKQCACCALSRRSAVALLATRHTLLSAALVAMQKTHRNSSKFSKDSPPTGCSPVFCACPSSCFVWLARLVGTEATTIIIRHFKQ